MHKRTLLAASAALAASVCLPVAAHSKDTWPVKTITLVQPYAPGGTSDMLARILAQELEKRIDATVVVDSKLGANGNLATAFVSQAQPDGSTFLVGSSSPIVIAPALHKNVTYNPRTDLTPISPLAKAPFLLVTGAHSGIGSVDALVEQIKAHSVSFGSAGMTSPQHVMAEMFHMHAKAKSPHIPYKGSAPLVIALMANEVAYGIDNPVPLLPQIESGKIKALAITSKYPSPKFPDIPSLHELGYTDFDVEPWYGVMGAKNLPKELTERMNGYVRDILAQASIQAKITDLGADAYALSTSEFAALIDADIKKWGEAVKASSTTAD